MASSNVADFDLFLDESGTFTETSTNPAELAAANLAARPFPSQLAGLLVPRGELTAGRAQDVLRRAQTAAGLPAGPVHARDLPRGSYDRFVQVIVGELVSRHWQPVRLVNRERVRYGDRAATYTNLVAEFVLRICQQKTKEGIHNVRLRMFCSRVTLREHANGTLDFLKREVYLDRLTQYLGFAAVRRGLTPESAAWQLEDLHVRSARSDAELQLCDVISHASHDDFHPVDATTATALRTALGAYDFSLAFREVIERVDQDLNENALALALLELAVYLNQDGLAPDVQKTARQRLHTVVDRLAGLSVPARDPHLALLITWLEQVIELQRALERGYRFASWLQQEVEQPLRERLGSSPDQHSVDWFRFALHTWALTASNHRGSLHDARREAVGIEALIPKLAGHWEHATLMMRGLVAEAVHRTDCFDYAAAASRMSVVAGYYGSFAELFHSALPDLFPTRVRSDLHGRALGTWLQSEILAGLREPARLPAARELSDRAIDEFVAVGDKDRQYQYRSQLETAAGNFAEARRYLAHSLGLDSDMHAALAGAILVVGERSRIEQGFALLHWLRLGVTAALDAVHTEAAAFLAAVATPGVLDSPWCQGEMTDYPVHGILRRVAVVQALRGDVAAAVASVRRLGDILDSEPTERLVLDAVRLAAHAEVAALLRDKHAKQARQLLDNGVADRPGLLQLLDRLEAKAKELASVRRLFAEWSVPVRGVVDGAMPPATLATLARAIGY
jgi:hypothetical protein